jgi:UDP-N-acetylmuramoylalanine--D-glutamate ligase
MELNSIESYQDAVVTVMGLGRYEQGSGLGATKWLMRQGAQVIVTDLKSEEELEESMQLVMEWYNAYRKEFPDRTLYQPLFVLGEHRKEHFEDVDLVVKNPAVPTDSEFIQHAEEAGIPVESDVSLFFRFCPYPLIAVTGTKGKTTTTKLIGEMLKEKDEQAIIAGNINVSPLEFLDELLARGEPTPIVLEFSSWLLESMPNAFQDAGKGPHVAVLTNIFPDHLDRYHSYGDYIHTKEMIFEWQQKDQYTVLNFDNELTKEMQVRVKGQLYRTSKTALPENGAYIQDKTIVFKRDGGEETILPLSEVALAGEHNIENILTAVCAAKLYGIDTAAIASALKSFTGVAYRQELVREVDEISYINDTTATNPDAVIAALNRFGADSDVILLAGGVNKDMEFEGLAAAIARTCKAVLLFEGDASQLLASMIEEKVTVETGFTDMQTMVNRAKALSASGDIVLLSPGAASFNLFKNEFDRGEQFREAVRNL